MLRGVVDATVFYCAEAAMVVVAAGIGLIPHAPLGLITTAVQAIAGILLPSATVFVVLLCNDRAVLGPWVNKPWLNIVATLIVSALTLYFPTNLNFTLQHFEYLGAHATSLQNSFVYSMIPAIGCSIFALFAGRMVQRGTLPGRKTSKGRSPASWPSGRGRARRGVGGHGTPRCGPAATKAAGWTGSASPTTRWRTSAR